MNGTITFSILFVMLSIAGCTPSKDAATPLPESVLSPVEGVWQTDDEEGIVVFLPSGEVIIEHDEILASLNRFQNTERSRYTSRLRRTARYEVISDEEVVLHLKADWTGKGTGARRPQGKQVESRIVFGLEPMDEDMIKFRKISLNQEKEETNLNAEEMLVFTLNKKK